MNSADGDNGLPPGAVPLEHQVAGHAFNDSKPRIGLLVQENGHVLKPIEGPVRGKREVNFYKELETNSDPIYQELKTFIPQYFGIQKIPWNGEEVGYIVLSNAAANMVWPCIMDIKIGRRTWDPEAPPSKKDKELKKYAECKKEFGFCIPGLQVYDASNGKLTRLGKEFGKDLGRESTKEALKRFLNVETGKARPTIEKLLTRMRSILSWCQRQRNFLLFSSSLLLAYDASQLSNPDVPATVTMIDFAHVFPSSGEQDLNYTEGVENLVKLFEAILSEL